MSFKMVALSRCRRSGAYVARKAIPADVRDAHQELYGARWETKFYLRGDAPLSEAKSRFAAWQAEIDARLEMLRSAARREGRGLTHREAHALVGEWYSWFVTQCEDEPGASEDWDYLLGELTAARLRYAPREAEDLPPDLANDLIDGDAQVQAHIRHVVSDRALASRFLSERGLVLSLEARDRFLVALVPEYVAALNLLRRRAEGDYSTDPRPYRFPKVKPAGRTCWQLFADWIEERRPKASTVDRRRAVFLHLQAYFGDRDIASISDEDALKWKDSLVTPERSGQTVNEVWLNAAKSIFNWALANKKTTSNPFHGLRVAYPKKARDRESRAFTLEEANTILRTALQPQKGRLSSHYRAARRWVPWLCAYTGARVQEITQLRAEDVVEIRGIWAIRLLPSAGTLKTNQARTVPIHEHLIEQGFLDLVRSVGKGPLFYDAAAQAAQVESDPTNPQKPLAVKTREHLAAWVRKIGITDPELSPNHSWRHLFKQIADQCGMREKVSDAITGHAPATVGRSYGPPTLEVMAQELSKFPRFTDSPAPIARYRNPAETRG